MFHGVPTLISKATRPIQALIRWLASTRPGSAVLSRSLPGIDPLVLRLTRGRATLTSTLAGVPVMMVTTRGARSGKLHRVPLLPVRDPADARRFALIASNWGQRRIPAWYFNLKARPQAECEMDGSTAAYTVHEAQGDEYELFWRAAVEIYHGYARYRERAGRRIPILVMERHEA